jgi:NitT/TauT family transport system permease protein
MSSLALRGGPSATPPGASESGSSESSVLRAFRNRPLLLARVGALAVIIVVWQLLPQSLLPSIVFGKPWDVLMKLGSLARTGTLFTATAGTLETTILGVVIGAPIGLVLAALTALPVVRWVLEPLATLAYAIPKIGLVSLFILWYGLSSTAHLVLVLMTVVFIYYFAAQQGLREVEKRKVTAMRMMGAGRLKIARSLVIGSITPHLLGATRLALPLGFGTAIFAEIRVPTQGNLGLLINQYSQSLDGAGAVAVIIAVAVIAFLIDTVARATLKLYSRRVGTGISTDD